MANGLKPNDTATHYHILEDGTVIGSKHKLEIGDRFQKPASKENPGPSKFLKVKFTMTNGEYTIACDNMQKIVKTWNDRKNEIVRARTGWNSVVKKNLTTELYAKFVTDEPLMKEAFFMSMVHFV